MSSSRPSFRALRTGMRLQAAGGAGASPDRARTMRRVATGLLVLMAIAYVALRLYAPPQAIWGYVLAFVEAGMVGGLADWFAVTALFRHPLGLPIPHTAIIPENKDRIADSMAVFLQDNFLTPAVVARRMAGMNVAAALGGFLSNPAVGEESRFRVGAIQLVGDILESLDQEKLGGMLKSGLRSQLDKINLAPIMGQVLAGAIADKRHLSVIESLLNWTARTVEANESLIRDMIRDRANTLLRWTGLDAKVANTVLDGLYRLLAEATVDPEHPLRQKMEQALEGLAHDLQHDPAMQLRIERLKQEAFSNPAVLHWMDGMWERARGALLRGVKNPDRVMDGIMGESMRQMGEALRHDARLQFLVNRFARRSLVGVVSRYGGAIVRLVSETVKRWDGATITTRLEGAVGRDLQFIRLNGTMVGGLVGLILHALDHAFF